MTIEEKAIAYAENLIDSFGVNGVPCDIKDIKHIIAVGYFAGATEALASQWRSVEEELKDNNAEIWNDIPDCNGQYQASNLGRIRKLKYGEAPMVMKGCLDSHGYFQVYINGKLRLAHRLVAMAFIPNPDKLPVVNHKDENPQNNHVKNLEWCTKQYNSTYGSAEQWKFTPVSRVDTQNGEVLDFPSIKEASIKTQTPVTTIHNALRHSRLCGKRYRWFYNQFLYNKGRGDKRPIPSIPDTNAEKK